MTDIDKIESMTLEELESRAMEVPGEVPGDLQARTMELLDSLEIAGGLLDEGHKGTVLRFAGIAAAIALLFSIGAAWQQRPPKDTFSDPLLAYASLEEAFDRIGQNVRKGSGIVEDTNEKLAKPVEILNNTIKK